MKWKYADSERPKGLCYDCGRPYGSFQDLIISDDLWEQINPTYHEHAGLLCPTCICNRITLIYPHAEYNLLIKHI